MRRTPAPAEADTGSVAHLSNDSLERLLEALLHDIGVLVRRAVRLTVPAVVDTPGCVVIPVVRDRVLAARTVGTLPDLEPADEVVDGVARAVTHEDYAVGVHAIPRSTALLPQ